MRKQPLVLASLLFVSVVTAAQAQSPPSTATPPSAEARDPRACQPSQEVPSQPGATTGQSSDTKTNQDLGDKLAQTDGVLCPPSGMDPAIRAPTPNTGRMPVIPPPGSPGGDPNIRPK
jgi:hypothetical protein